MNKDARELDGSGIERSVGARPSYRKTAILVGVLFLSSTATFVAGAD